MTRAGRTAGRPLTRAERRAFTRFTHAAVAPAPPLPPVPRTDAVRAFEATLAASPPLHRLGLRAGFLVAGLLGERAARAEALKPLRSLAYFHYYGDPEVMVLLGYDADGVVERAREARRCGA